MSELKFRGRGDVGLYLAIGFGHFLGVLCATPGPYEPFDLRTVVIRVIGAGG